MFRILQRRKSDLWQEKRTRSCLGYRRLGQKKIWGSFGKVQRFCHFDETGKLFWVHENSLLIDKISLLIIAYFNFKFQLWCCKGCRRFAFGQGRGQQNLQNLRKRVHCSERYCKSHKWAFRQKNRILSRKPWGVFCISGFHAHTERGHRRLLKITCAVVRKRLTMWSFSQEENQWPQESLQRITAIFGKTILPTGKI